MLSFFFFNDTATTEIYTLSLHDALPISNRIGIAEGDDPIVVERQLCAAMPKERWTRTSDTLILHGRRICRPKPLCDTCVVQADCEYFNTAVSVIRVSRVSNRAPRTVRKARR